MEKQLVIMSTITYLLLFNNSITFRLTRKNNFWIMIISGHRFRCQRMIFPTGI